MGDAFTIAGVLPSHYTKMTRFSRLGCVCDAYVGQGMNGFSPTSLFSHIIQFLITVHKQNWYRQFVNMAAEILMQAAVEEIKALPH